MKILITGASKGIGYAVAHKFLNEGYTVVGLDVLESDIVHERYIHYICDVSKKESLPNVEGVQILVNNAGVQNQNDIEVNLLGAMYVTQKYAFDSSIKSILNVASSSARTGAEFPEYAVSKGGLVTYTKYVAQQIARFGATCNSLSPGGVVTGLNSHIFENEDMWEFVKDETLLHKWAYVDEIAEYIYFMTVINKSMTAQDILVDNGERAKCNFIW